MVCLGLALSCFQFPRETVHGSKVPFYVSPLTFCDAFVPLVSVQLSLRFFISFRAFLSFVTELVAAPLAAHYF